MQVACGGDHTLAVCQHEVGAAAASLGADRRVLGSWSKRRDPGLSIEVPPTAAGGGRDPFGAPSAGLPLSASASALPRDSMDRPPGGV